MIAGSKDRHNERAYIQAVLKEYVWLPGTPHKATVGLESNVLHQSFEEHA